jgi:RNA polymerase sigma factor (sigma-70 family)
VESDRELIQGCLAGDRVAWSDLLARYGDLIYGLMRKQGLDSASAADGFQEVTIALWKAMGRLRGTENLLPWIATTTRRIAWRALKRARMAAGRQAAAARSEADPGASPGEALALLEREQAVRRALAALGDRCRQLLSALYFQPFEDGYTGLAQRLGIPRGALGPTRQRCLEGLRAQLALLGFSEMDVSPEAPQATYSSQGRRRSSRSGPR